MISQLLGRTTPRLTAMLSLLCAVTALDASGQDGLKIYISADMEGVTGAVSSEQLGPAGFEYGRFRQFLTDEVNAAITAARGAGATEFVISDSHGNGQNLLIDQLPADVTVVRSWPRPLSTWVIGSTHSDAKTPISWRLTRAGLESGPSRLKIVRVPSSTRVGPTWRMAL